MENKGNSKNVVIAVLITLLICVIGFCIYLIINNSNNVNKDNNGKVNNMNNENKEDNKVDKNADINKSILMNLYDNNVIDNTEIRKVIETDIDYTLDYGKIDGHNLKIKIYIKDTGKTVETDSSLKLYKQTLDVYVDNEKYNLFDLEKSYMYSTGIGELFENIDIKVNKMGIIIINKKEFTAVDSSTEPFILIYNKSNKFEYINDNIITQYSNKTDLSGYGWDTNYITKEPITVYDEYITYCKYDKSNYEELEGKSNIKCIKYNGSNEEILKEVKNAYIHMPLA